MKNKLRFHGSGLRRLPLRALPVLRILLCLLILCGGLCSGMPAAADSSLVLPVEPAETAVREGTSEAAGKTVSGSRTAKKTAEKKKILFVGDSITWGYITKNVRASATIPSITAKTLGIACRNAGKNGARVTNTGKCKQNSLVRRFESNAFHMEKYSVIVIAAGTNDFGGDVMLGPWTGTSAKKFYGAWHRIFKTIRKKNPGAKVVIMTPIYRSAAPVRQSRTGYKIRNRLGYSLQTYVNAEVRIAKKYGASVYDSSKKLVINRQNAKTLLKDGLHPTRTGYRKLGQSVAVYLKKLVK